MALDELLARGDVVSLHTPLTPETHYLINGRTLALMKDGAYLVNSMARFGKGDEMLAGTVVG